MSLTPKNWKTFQHYSDRKPAWIKLHKVLLDDFAFASLPLASRALAPLLWLLASEYDDGNITASLEEIAFRVRCSTDELRDALNPLVKSGFFIDASNLLARCEQGACLEREIQEEKQVQTEKEETSSPSLRDGARNVRRETNLEFDEFKKAYPKREGSQPWQPARKKFEALTKSGVDPEHIISAARGYAAEQQGLGKVGTQFIAQAVVWLNQRRDLDYAGNPTGPPTGLTEEEKAKWVRDQMEAERAQNQSGDQGVGNVLERGHRFREAQVG